ncbi:MAG TPA: hypothetical protein VKQ32_24965 [Polyangia bacterium]|nr:hypothetical protein [Polyangia bacterium]
MTARRAAAVAASITAWAVLAPAHPARAAHSPFAWAPAGTPVVERGRSAASRFRLLALHEVTVEVDDAFAAANRQALALAEQRIAEVPGVRAVFGPAGLLDITSDARGNTSARPVLGRGGAATQLGPAESSEGEGEAARQRVVRRADALGWFLTENGRRVRFYVDTDDWPRVAGGVTNALAASGLGLAPASTAGLEAQPLWPDPRRPWRLLPVGFAAAWTFFAVVALRRAGVVARPRSGARRLWPALAAAVGAAAPFALVPVGGVRAVGGAAALAAGVLAAAFWPGRGETRAPAVAGPRRRWPVLLLALAAAAGGFALLPSLRIGTRQWAAAPMFFVSVRGELDEPVVLREVRRVTDELRDQPGVANAWSVADLFMGVTLEGDVASRIPDDPEQVRRILVQARTDPAVRLELAGDHREALIAVRFDDDPTVDHLTIVAGLERYLALELRRALLRVDLSAPGVSPVTRSIGRGVLAVDARERVLRICARSGRPLDASEALAVERVARQAATIPVADPARLDADIAENVRDFISRHPFPLGSAETNRLVAAVASLGDGASVDDIRVAIATAYGARLSDAIQRTTAESLARRVATVRRRHIASTNFKDMLYGAQLPNEGVLADEVRSATLDAMGPVVGIPAPDNSVTAYRLDLVPVGGAPNDRALSLLWRRALGAGTVAAAGLLAILLVLTGGAGGVLSLPLAFAPAAAAIAPAALLGEPVGLPTLSFYAGALAAGALLALAVTPAVRPDDRQGRA